MRIAIIAFSAFLAPSAWAATIDGPNTLGCRDIEVHRRIGRAAGARDGEGIEAIVNAAMRAGVCSPLPVGLKVRIEDNSFPYACVTKFGTAGPCLWIMQREVDVKE